MSVEYIESSEDVQLLQQLVERPDQQRMYAWFASSDQLVKTYLIARACHLARSGKALADRTFPQPTIKSVPPQQVAAVLDWLVRLLQETWRRNEEQEEKTWLATAQRRLQQETLAYYERKEKNRGELVVRNHVRINNQDIYIPDHLPPRVLSAKERGEVREACLKELRHGNEAMYGRAGLKVLEDCVRFCELLHRPENLMQVASAQYVEREVNTYTTQEMTNQMAQELINLQPHSAYVKVVSVTPGKQSVWKGKIQTLALEETRAGVEDVDTVALRHATDRGILKPRSDIEKEIRERQENWRRRGGNEPPPPTSTGGNSPPSLPSGNAGSGNEPPPTHSIPEKAPQVKPRGSSDVRDWSAERGGRSGQKTEQKEPKREEKYTALREQLIPIVQQALVRYEAKSKTEMIPWRRGVSLYSTVSCVLALRDKIAAKRLLQQLIDNNGSYADSFTGRLAILTGEEGKAKEIIQYFEDKYKPKIAANIAADLLDKTTAKRLLWELEKQGRISEAVDIAIKIGDSETRARSMQAIEKQGLTNIESYTALSLLAPFYPDRTMQLLKRHEGEWQKQGLLDVAGAIAALCGDNATVQRSVNALKSKGDFYHCCDIAAIMGDVSTAEKMMWEYQKKNVEWFNENYDQLCFTVSTHNPEARYHLLQALQKQGYDVGLIAARILEKLGSTSS